MTKEELIAEGYDIFSEFPRPAHFQNCQDHNPESIDHESLLQSRDRNELALDDVGGIGYNPITQISPEGFAYFLPRLLELALDMKTKSTIEAEPYLWSFIIQIMPDNDMHKYSLLHGKHKSHICKVLRFIKQKHMDYIKDHCFETEYDQTIQMWCDQGT